MTAHVQTDRDLIGSRLIKLDLENRQGRYSTIPNSWSDAWIDRRMSDHAMKIVHYLCRKFDTYRITQRTLASKLGFGLDTTNKALLNLHELGVASKHVNKGKTVGYTINMNVEIPAGSPTFRRIKDVSDPVSGTRFQPSGRPSDPEPDTLADPEPGSLYKTPSSMTPCPSPSLREEKGQAGSARPAMVMRADQTGQIGISFADDQGVIPDRDVEQIMASLRQENLGGDPEDFELREFVLSRIAFLTRPDFKGKPMVRGDKAVAAANRAKVVKFCMNLIAKDDFRWTSRRVDQTLARRRAARVAQIAKEIEEQRLAVSTVLTPSGARISAEENLKNLYAIKDRRDQLISSRLARRPSRYTPAEWRRRLEESFTEEVVAKDLFADKAASMFATDWKRQREGAQARIDQLRAEESRLRLSQ